MTLLIVVVNVCIALYAALQLFNFYAFVSASSASVLPDLTQAARALPAATLPTYAILVPLYKETAVLEQLIGNLQRLNYPAAKLDVILLIEADDTDMIAALQRLKLPAHFRVIYVPVSYPRTKPKALNVGLTQVTSDYLVVYDAEDAPDPDQLRKAIVAFNQAAPSVVCVQALLAYHNPLDNLLTRYFTAEYATWFRLMLPGLAQHRLLMLLGGTSNHFKTLALRMLNGWDAYNVTEDADLGIRLVRAGYDIEVLNSLTWEEANARPYSWIKQRSRWIKGYMQTYLTHMRQPFKLLRELRLPRFITFQMLVGISPLLTMLNPIFWSLTGVYFLTRAEFIERLFQGPTFYVGLSCMLLGNFFAIYLSMTGSLLHRDYGSVKLMLFTPVYWLMMSIASWRAFNQLIYKPHFWEKTMHGHSKSRFTLPAGIESPMTPGTQS
jgi:cellulose synthase/poly-beta-1,6-N-acetylglucosamine synthase-like glycosyltransferase